GCLGVGMVLGLPDVTYYRSLPLLLGVEGGLALWLSLALGVQWLFYGVLGLWGMAAALVKFTYFPVSGSGLTMMGVALLIWAVLWWVQRAPVEVAALRQEREALRGSRATSLTLLWCFPVTFQPPQTVVRVPLQQAMVLVWGLGVVLLAQPTVRRLAHVCHLHGDRTLLEHIAHWTAFTMMALSLGIPLVQYGVFIPHVAFVLTLGTGMAFWVLAAQRYQRRLH